MALNKHNSTKFFIYTFLQTPYVHQNSNHEIRLNIDIKISKPHQQIISNKRKQHLLIHTIVIKKKTKGTKIPQIVVPTNSNIPQLE